MAVCGIGLWAWTEKDTFTNIGRLTNVALDPAMVFIMIGGVMFIIGFTGCVGALRENTKLLLFVSNIDRYLCFTVVFIEGTKLDKTMNIKISNCIKIQCMFNQSLLYVVTLDIVLSLMYNVIMLIFLLILLC